MLFHKDHLPYRNLLEFKGDCKFRWEKSAFLFLLNYNSNFSISFHYECRQSTTLLLAISMTLSTTEITDIS